jgi:hypothetical protein
MAAFRVVSKNVIAEETAQLGRLRGARLRLGDPTERVHRGALGMRAQRDPNPPPSS